MASCKAHNTFSGNGKAIPSGSLGGQILCCHCICTDRTMVALLSFLPDISCRSLRPPRLATLYDYFLQMIAWPGCRRDQPPGRSVMSPLLGTVCLMYHQVAPKLVHITR